MDEKPDEKPDEQMDAMPGSMSWPERRALCLDCRTALEAGATCPVAERHRVSPTDTASGRESLRIEVWGPSSRRRKVKEAAKASGGGIGGGAVVDGCGSCSGCDLGGASVEGLLVVLAVGVALIILYYLVKWSVAAWRRHQARPRPRGAVSRGAHVSRRHGVRGRVVAQTRAPAPMSQSPCVAFASELGYTRWWRSREIMLRDGATVGFDVVTDDGEVVRIPPGVVLVDMSAARPVDIDIARLETYLSDIDPLRDAGDQGDPGREFEPIPHTVPYLMSSLFMRELDIQAGALVHVAGPFEPRPDVRAPAGGYREQAPTVLMPTGVPRLVLLDDAE